MKPLSPSLREVLHRVAEWLLARFSRNTLLRQEQIEQWQAIDQQLWQLCREVIESAKSFQEEIAKLREELCLLNRQLLHAEKLRCTLTDCTLRRVE